MTINFYAIYKYFHSCSNDWYFGRLMHHSLHDFTGDLILSKFFSMKKEF